MSTPIRITDVRSLRGEARKAVCYVGRGFAGWPASPWANPFHFRNTDNPLERFREYAAAKPPEWLARLWEACEHGAKPLGCWCVDAVHGDGHSIDCHAQILAEMLTEWLKQKGAA